MNAKKPHFSFRCTKSAKHHKKDSLYSRRNKLIYHGDNQKSFSLVHSMTFDEMLEASSLFDSLLNGASLVNKSSVSPKARHFVQITHDKYEKEPQIMRSIYKKLNKEIVVANHGLYHSDPQSKALYAQVMNTRKR